MLTLDFPRRARVRRSELTTQRRYDSSCGRWALIEVNGVWGRYWLVVRRMYRGEYVKCKCKTRSAAEAACKSDPVRVG